MRTKMWLGYIHKPRVGERNRNEIAHSNKNCNKYIFQRINNPDWYQLVLQQFQINILSFCFKLSSVLRSHYPFVLFNPQIFLSLFLLLNWRQPSEIQESVLTVYVLEEQTQKWTFLDTDWQSRKLKLRIACPSNRKKLT